MLRKLRSHAPVLLCSALGLFAAAIVVLWSEDTGVKIALLAALLTAPFGWFVLTRRGPLISYVLLGHTISWVLRRFLPSFDRFSDWARGANVIHELNCLIAATALIIVGCLIANPSTVKSEPSRQPFEGREIQWQALTALAFGLAWIPFADWLPRHWDGPYQAAWPLGLAVLYTCRSPAHPKLLEGLRFLAVAIALVTFLRLGTLKVVLCLGLIWFGLVMIRPNPARLLGLALLVGLVGTLESVKNEFRIGTHRSRVETIGVKAGRLGQLLLLSRVPDWIRRGTIRAHDHSLEKVLALSPETVPFWQGESYADMWMIPVPRLLWKDKPSWQLWHEFGHRYHILRPWDPQTSVQIGYLAEGYANFGYLGLWAAALAFGLLLGTADRLVAPASRPGNLFGFMVFARIFFLPADAFTILSQLYQLLFLWAVLRGAVYIRDHFRKLNPALP